MNKIYKLVWSKVRNCYVVTCEFAKSHSKTSIRSYSLLALAVSLTLLNNQVLAAGTESHYVSINSTSTSSGSNYNNDGASGANAIAIGQQATATAKNAVAIGYKAKAEGEGAFAFGEGAISKGKGTVAFIGGNEAYGTYSMAWGMNNIAGISVDGTETYIGATAFGTGTEARNSGATAMGNWSIAEGQNSVAMGNESHTHADAKASLAMGQETHTLGTGSFAGGTDSIAGGFNSFAHGYTAEAVGSTAIAMGDDAKAIGDESVALGYNSKAFGDYSVAVLGGRTGNGTFSYDEDFEMYDVDVTDNAIGAIAVGFGSVAMKDYTVALGRHATVNNEKGIALGEDALVSADESSALGYGSVATEENVISVGHKQGDPTYNGGTYSSALTRKIVNVADGVDDTDAVNVSQLNTSLVDKANVDLDNITGAGKNVIKTNAKEAINMVGSDKAVVTKTDVSGVDTYMVSVTSNGAVASGDTDIVTGGTVYDALQTESRPAADGNYITTANTAGVNLTALDTAVKANEDAIADLGNGKANVALDNITDNGKSVIKTNAKEAINVIGSGKAIVTKTDASGVDTYTVDVTANGQVADGDTNIVTGGTVRTALLDETRPVSDGNYIAQSGTAGANLTALDTAVKTNVDAIDALDTNKANISLDNITDAGKTVIQNATNVVSGGDIINVTSATADGVKTYTVTANISADGQIVSGNTGLVSGSTVYSEVRPVSDGNYIAVANTAGANLTTLDTQVKVNTDAIEDLGIEKANVSLNNITSDGETVIKNLAKSSINVIGTNKAVVTKTDENGVDTYTVDVKADGAVAQGDGNIVSGGAVYDALETAKSEISDALDTKANKDASNISSNAEDWGAAIGTGTVDAADGKLVTGSTVAGETRVASNGNYIASANTAGQNITALDTQVKVNADAIEVLGTDKVNVSLDNITDAGKTVIQNATNVVSGDDSINVTSATADGVKTYTVSANFSTDGQVVSGNTGLVSGGTVFNEVRPADGEYVSNSATTGANLNALDNAVKSNKDSIDGLSDGKANISLDNINDDGKDVIQKIARDSVKVQGRNHITSELVYDADGNAVYRVEDVVDGLVAENNKGIVDGGTVFNAIKDAKDEVTDATDTKLQDYAKKDASNVSDAGAWGEKIATGSVSENEVRAVSGDTVYRALQNSEAATQRALNGKANVSLDNLNMDGKNILQQYAITSVKVADGENTTVSSEYDADGNITYKVAANVTGTVTNGDTNIVSGGTVYSALKDLSDNTDAQLDTKANKDLDNISDDGKSVVRTLAQESLKVVDGDNTTVLEGTDGDAKTYAVHAVTDGVIASGNTGIVTGGTVYDALKTVTDNVTDSLEGKADINLQNIDTDGKTVVRNIARDAVQVQGDDHITSERVYDADGNSVYRLTAKTDGIVENNNTGLVSGGTVFDETRSSDGNYISKTNTAGENITALDDALKDVSDTVDETKEALDGKANTGLDNITPAGERVIKDLAKDSVIVKSGEYTNVVKSDEAGVDTYTVNTVVNGTVASGNTGIVTGGTVYDAIQDVVSDTSDALDTKANVSLDNLNTDGNRYLQQKAIQSVKVVDGENTTVTSSYDADGNISYAVKAVADGEIAQGNGSLVTGGTVYDALKSQSDTMTEELNKKANADASNVTDAQAWGEKIATGQIASGDARAVSGDTVNAWKTSVEEGLDNKANTSLDNITDNGKNVVRDLAKESISVVGDDDVVVTKQTAGNADEYSLSIRKNGTVASGDEALITGSTMFTELRPSDGNYVRNSYTTAGNLTALDAKLKETYDIAVAAGQTGTDENAVHYDGADKSVVTMAGADGTKLTNLKDGEISRNSKDAVTGGQLYQVKQDVAANIQAIDTLSDKVGDTVDGTYVQSANSVGQNLNVLDSQVKSNTDAISSLTEGMNGKADTDLSNLSDAGKDNVKNIAKESVEVVSSDNSVSVTKTDTDTLRTFDLSVNKDGKVEEGNNGIVTGGTVYNAIQDIQVVVDDVEEKLDGKMNKDMSNLTEEGKDVIKEAVKPELDKKANTDASNIDVNAWSDKLGVGEVAEGDNGLVKGDTVYQALQDVKDGAVSVEGDTIRIGGKAKYDNVDKVSVAKSDGSGRVITGVVTDVSDDTSAANVGYVKAVGETIIDGVNAGLHKMDNKINKVGAGAAALASIAPMPFDEDRKWTVAAAIGTYKGEQAGAIGAFYKPQENIMFNVRGVIGNGENMAGAGITIGLDKGPAKGLSKVAMAKVINTQAQEIQAQKVQLDAQKAELEAQKAEIQQLKEMVQKIASK